MMKYLKWCANFAGAVLATVMILSVMAVHLAAERVGCRKVLAYTDPFMIGDDESYWAAKD